MSPRPKRGKQIVLRLSDEEVAALEALADRLGTTRSEATRQAIAIGITFAGKASSRPALLDLLAAIEDRPRPKRED